MNRNTMIGGLVVVVVLVIIGLVMSNLEPSTSQEEGALEKKTQEETVRDEKKIKGEPMDEESVNLVITHPSSKIATLKDVSGGTSSGTGYVLRRDKILRHVVTANLPPPAEGAVYEGWLVKREPELTFFSTGVLEKQVDGTYSLSFMSDALYEGFDFVVLTIETEVDDTPEDHIVEGLAV